MLKTAAIPLNKQCFRLCQIVFPSFSKCQDVFIIIFYTLYHDDVDDDHEDDNCDDDNTITSLHVKLLLLILLRYRMVYAVVRLSICLITKRSRVPFRERMSAFGFSLAHTFGPSTGADSMYSRIERD